MGLCDQEVLGPALCSWHSQLEFSPGRSNFIIFFFSPSTSVARTVGSLSRVHMDWQITCPDQSSWHSEENEDLIVTLETVVSMERDKVVWTSRVKHTCLSAVLISCTDERKEGWQVSVSKPDEYYGQKQHCIIYQLYTVRRSSPPSPFFRREICSNLLNQWSVIYMLSLN